MSYAAVVTLILTAVLVLALAWYLIQVIRVLAHVNDQLGKITFGVRAIAHRTIPVEPLVGEIESDLDAVAGALEGVVAKATNASRQAA